MKDQQGDRAKRKQNTLTRTFWALVIAFVVVLLVTATCAVAEISTTQAGAGPLSSSTAAPGTVAEPLPTASPTAEPSSTPLPSSAPSPQPAESWTFQGAQITIPCVGIGGPVTEYTEAMLIDGAVEPATADTISWYSAIPGGILSESASNTAYVYGHSGAQAAIFNDVRKMTPGCEAIITTGNGETLTYVMSEPVFPVLKPDLPYDPRVREATAGRLILVSCYRPDGYDPNSISVENVVAVLQLESPSSDGS